MKQDSEIAPTRGRRVNEFLNRRFSDLCELCLCLKVFAACVNFPIYEASRIRIFLPPRREERQVRINIISLSLRPLRRRSGHASLRLRSGHALREISRLFWLRRSRVCLCGEYFSVTCFENYRISKFGVCFSKRFELSEAVEPFDRLRAGFWNDRNGLVCWLTQDQLIGYSPPKTAIRGLVRRFH